VEPCKYERDIIDSEKGIAVVSTQITALDKRINGAFEKISRHIENGTAWHVAIISVIVAVVLQVIVIAYFAGRFTKVIDIYENSVTAYAAAGAKK
jgi:hypothetical protein